ncbi:putative disease resistance protein RGA4 [Rosa sericea]
MAEALISRLLERLSSLREQLREADLSLGVRVEKVVEKFILDLRAVQPVLVDAEARQLVEAPVRRWLDNLEEVCNEMENVMAELSVAVNKRKNQETAPSTKKKVCLSILSNSFCLGHSGRAELKIISWRIRELGQKLTLIANERQMFNYQHIERSVGKLKRGKVLSLVNTDRIFGREEELEFLLSKLLSVGSQQEMSPVVIPIVGMGGLGKTALARLAYNDDRVKTHFEERIWVCVSDPFDEFVIAKSIIKGTEHVIPQSHALDIFLQCVSESIGGKRFLLVLDDVWTEDNRKWERLQSALQNGAVGSRILVTTRKNAVAWMMGTKNPIHMNCLSEENCWLLFCNFAQFDREKDVSKSQVARVFVRRCKGLPLVTKILGSLMLYKETIHEWQDVLNSKIWELEKVEQQVFQVLLLSYYDLTPAIRPCLLYCAMLPKDFLIDKDSLVELWMSQDYLSSEENEEKEIVGQRYFENLVMRSFFQDFKKDEEGNIRWCKMHDIVHDFLLFLTKDECITVEEGDHGGGEPSKIHHLTLKCASQELTQSSFSISNCKNLRTIITFDSEVSTLDLDLILQLKYLRTLSLNCGHIEEVPTSIGSLVHLRYLCLSDNQIFKELPNTMCNLYNLQTLHLISCERLEKLPEGIDKLSNLRNLHVIGCEELVYLPEVIGKLVGLRYIDLSYNRSLINLPNGLCDLNNLQTLRLSWCEQLEELPEAIGQLIDLKHLHVDGCNMLEYLPEGIGRLNDLRYLDLSHNHFLIELPVFICTLYNLQTLRLNGCERLVELPEAIGKLISLKHLHAARCDQLQYLPEGIGKLVRLRDIDLSHNYSLKELPNTMRNIYNLRTLCLVGCPQLVNVDIRELIKDEQHESEYLQDLQEAFGRLTRLLTPLGCNVSSGDKNDALSIKSLGNVKDVSEAEKAELKNVDLLSLELDFDNEEDERIKGDAELLNVLRPHQVEFLRIAEYHGLTVPLYWTMPLQNLRHLILEEWTYCEVLPPLGKLPSLEKLEMTGMHGLKKIGAEFLGTETDIDQVSFPKLKQLSFGVMQDWEEWEGVEGCTIMPSLSSLRINSCSLLQVLPQFLWKTPLDDLVINWCPILTQDLLEGGGDEWSKISHISSIRINCITVGRETDKVAASKVDDKEEDEITEVLE